MIDAGYKVMQALAKCAVEVEAMGPAAWGFTVANGADLAARAHLDDGWLVLAAGLDGVGPRGVRAWECLAWNATLAGGARFALQSGGPGVHVRAELPVEDGVDLVGRVAGVCTGFKAARHALGHTPHVTLPAAGGSGVSADDLHALCRETGWPVAEREPGRLAITLDVPGGFQQAIVEGRGDGGVVAALPVLDPETGGRLPAAPVCREALGDLLLRTCRVVRMARVAADGIDGRPQARFEVVFATLPGVGELQHAFGALSVAHRLAGREAAVVWTDEAIAAAYIHHQQHKEGFVWDTQQQ